MTPALLIAIKKGIIISFGGRPATSEADSVLTIRLYKDDKAVERYIPLPMIELANCDIVSENILEMIPILESERFNK